MPQARREQGTLAGAPCCDSMRTDFTAFFVHVAINGTAAGSNQCTILHKVFSLKAVFIFVDYALEGAADSARKH